MKKIDVGDKAQIIVQATDETIRQIADISGDVNPIHLDENYAASTVFKKRIAHGLFCINGISRLLGTVLPGEGAILLSQEFKYKKPVYIGDEICIEVSVREIDREKSVYHLDIVCTNQENHVVLEGNSSVKWIP